MKWCFNLNGWFLSADRRAKFEQLEYTEEEYQKELEHIEQVGPLRNFHIGFYADQHLSYFQILEGCWSIWGFPRGITGK